MKFKALFFSKVCTTYDCFLIDRLFQQGYYVKNGILLLQGCGHRGV